MRRKENNVEAVPEEQEEKNLTRNEGTSVPETDDLLRDLQKVLEIPELEKTEDAASSAQNPGAIHTPGKTDCSEQSIERAACAEAVKPTPKMPEQAEKPAEPKLPEQAEKPAEPKLPEQAEKPAEPKKPVKSAEMQKTKRMPVTTQKKPETEQSGANPNPGNDAMAQKQLEHDPQKADEPFAQSAVDDESLIAELHALIGDPIEPKPAQRHAAGVPSGGVAKPFSPPAPRPKVRITPEALKDVPEEFEDVAEADTMGVPGWLKGALILLLSLLLCAMTFYAVASDVIGEIF